MRYGPGRVDRPTVSVIVPVYDEAATIAQVVLRIADLPLDKEIVAVDDGSRDRTPEILAGLAAEVDGLRVEHRPHAGKGAAVRHGIAVSRGDVVAIQDADLEYDPGDIPRLIAPLLEGRADAVYGTRRRGGQAQLTHPFWRYVGNRALSLLTNVLYNTTISDMEVGAKAFRGDLAREFRLVSDDFRIEAELTANVVRSGARLYEVPIAYHGRSYAEGKKITWRDGLLAVAALVRFRFGTLP
jgi:glycosyltransferase involved in cell wall biosynthesis